MTRVLTIVLCLSLGAGGASASAQHSLKDEVDINHGLLIMAVADKIRRECNSIAGRMFRAQKFAKDLKAVAEARGYSMDQIEAYVNDRSERARVRAERNVYFESQGASNLDHQSLCVLGHAEIARKSQIGHLLKAK